jgi:hypothetical protein
MKRSIWIALAVCGCSSSSTPSADAPVGITPDSPIAAADAPKAADAPAALADAPAASADAPKPVDAPPPPDAAEMVTLTIQNFGGWCTTAVGGMSYPGSTPPPTPYVKGTVVHIHAEKASNTFVWGYWTGTDPGGMDTNMDTTVTMTMDKSVLACCPVFTDPTPSCPTD